MQLYAYDIKRQLVHARNAIKQISYFCLECHQVVRVRSGPHRRHHFYHISPTPLCRQHQKGAIHLCLQDYLLQQLFPADCCLEMHFRDINRIADVAWLSQKIVFEIQCSPISAHELLQRNRDYAHVGWKVIWILHDSRYNQVRLSAAEIALRTSPHYFSNMDAMGNGIIYDQFDICEKGIRKQKLHSLKLNLNDVPLTHIVRHVQWPLITGRQRVSDWKVALSGDLLSLVLNHPLDEYLQNAKALESLWHLLPTEKSGIAYIKQF